MGMGGPLQCWHTLCFARREGRHNQSPFSPQQTFNGMAKRSTVLEPKEAVASRPYVAFSVARGTRGGKLCESAARGFASLVLTVFNVFNDVE